VQSSSQSSLFGGSVASYVPEPAMPDVEEWPLIEKLKYEKTLSVFI
jgi:DNA polymerase-3 subunit alpha